MTAALRKGWCPGAVRPMMAKDGLLVRLRITGGILAAETASALADLAERFGSGLFDLSARGNLQLRGVREKTLPNLQAALAALGLIDDDAVREAVRNVIASPLAGLHGGIDIRPLTAALEHRLSQDASLHALPAKFGFLIDDGSSPTLAGVSADIRFDWTGRDFLIGLGGDASEAVHVGRCSQADLVDEAARLAAAFIDLSDRGRTARRVRDIGENGLRTAFPAITGHAAADIHRTRGTTLAHEIVGWRTHATSGTPALGLAAPFGRLDAAMLHAAASIAASAPCELRLTPWRVILLPGTPQVTDVAGFITDPDDPRLAVAACVGIDGCDRGSTLTREDASKLARALALRSSQGIALHVSGCAKGCAKASPSPITLVARDGRYDIVRDGRADGTALREGLDLDQVEKLLAAEC